MWLNTVALYFALATTTPPPQAVIDDLRIKSAIERSASDNGVSQEKMLALCELESNFNPKAWNKTDPQDGAKGLFQFLDGTFYPYARQFGFEKPDIWNYDQQIKLTAYLLAQNKWKLWTASKYIEKPFSRI